MWDAEVFPSSTYLQVPGGSWMSILQWFIHRVKHTEAHRETMARRPRMGLSDVSVWVCRSGGRGRGEETKADNCKLLEGLATGLCTAEIPSDSRCPTLDRVPKWVVDPQGTE